MRCFLGLRVAALECDGMIVREDLFGLCLGGVVVAEAAVGCVIGDVSMSISSDASRFILIANEGRVLPISILAQ